jgi:hypothetical protein
LAKKRQTFGKMQRERQRAEKRERKAERKEARKALQAAAEAAGLPWPPPEGMEEEYAQLPPAPQPEEEPEP